MTMNDSVVSVFALVACAAIACASPPEQGSVPVRQPERPLEKQMEKPPEPDIVQIGMPVLRGRATEVPQEMFGKPELRDLVARMVATMRAAPGVGLAAPQIGVPWRVIVLEDRAELIAKSTALETQERERTAFATRVFVNPVLETIGNERATFFEGCLSVRGYVGMVERAREVEVSGFDENGAAQKWRVRGWPARILQHEVDHLEGTIYVDRMITRSFSESHRAKELYGGKPIAEIRRLLGL